MPPSLLGASLVQAAMYDGAQQPGPLVLVVGRVQPQGDQRLLHGVERGVATAEDASCGAPEARLLLEGPSETIGHRVMI
jgi:hypothetical protein